MRSKRGEGLSLQVIVVAVLCIVVMVVLLYIFGGKIGLFKSSTSCASREGKCMSPDDVCGKEGTDKGPIMIWTEDCECFGSTEKGGPCNANKKPGQCCISIG